LEARAPGGNLSRMINTMKALIAGVLAVAALVIAAPAAVAADDRNNGRRVGAPANVRCTSNGLGAVACFRSRGDRIYVKDTLTDGRSAIAVWSHYLGPGSYRKGWCRNTHGAGTWALCNKELKENSYFEWWAVEYDGDSGEWLNWSRSESAIS
jgi:hypothetical protein